MLNIHSQPAKKEASPQTRQTSSEPALSHHEIKQEANGATSSPQLPSPRLAAQLRQAPSTLTPSDVVYLQRTIGNHAVARMLQKSDASNQRSLQRAASPQAQSN